MAVAAFWFLSFVLYPQLFNIVGVRHYGPWFIDSYAILASNDALSQGLDVYKPNPLDMFHRPHVYSHWWLHLRDLGLTRDDNWVIGFALCGLFFVTAAFFLRPHGWREALWYLVGFCSSPVVLALERANNDLVVFLLLAPVVFCLASRPRWLGFLAAAALIAAAAGLKYYPAVAACLLLYGAEPHEARRRLVVAGALFAALAINIAPDMARFSNGALPHPRGHVMVFGASLLLKKAGLSEPWILFVIGIVAGLAVFIFLVSPIFSDWTIAPEKRGAWLSFILGTSLLTGCFFTQVNYVYRWIFALWLLPFLWNLTHDAQAPRAVRRLGISAAMLLVAPLWGDAGTYMLYYNGLQRAGDISYLIVQVLIWLLFICLIGFLSFFIRGELRRLFGASDKSSQPAAA